MKSLFETEAYQEIQNRIESLDENKKALWGKMNVGQMTKHCQMPFKVIDGEIMPTFKIGFLKKMIFSMMKSIMYNDKLWKEGVPTSKEFIIDYDVNLTEEKANLLKAVSTFHERKNQEHWEPHPVFGSFKKEQWGKMQYKHLDHHLRQFGV